MVREGFALHHRTWNPDALAAALHTELEALDPSRIILPNHVAHIWPALPGAGLTPVLFGLLLGVNQTIRPSHRGQNFAALVSKLSGIELDNETNRWQTADVVVVSGSDDTLKAVRQQLRPGATLVGYGHRVSFGLVVDSAALDLDAIAADLATDCVMWHQQGCFSLRAVVFCGSEHRSREFAGALGNAIELAEQRLDATHLDDATLGQRAQALGMARFTSPVCGRGLGWVQPQTTPFQGRQISAHVVSLHRIESLAELEQAVDVPPHQLQGAALAIAATDERYALASEALLRLGATRVCRPGELQAPPAGWRHDGRANVLEWLRIGQHP